LPRFSLLVRARPSRNRQPRIRCRVVILDPCRAIICRAEALPPARCQAVIRMPCQTVIRRIRRPTDIRIPCQAVNLRPRCRVVIVPTRCRVAIRRVLCRLSLTDCHARSRPAGGLLKQGRSRMRDPKTGTPTLRQGRERTWVDPTRLRLGASHTGDALDGAVTAARQTKTCVISCSG
jgi:hypothetical protein